MKRFTAISIVCVLIAVIIGIISIMVFFSFMPRISPEKTVYSWSEVDGVNDTLQLWDISQGIQIITFEQYRNKGVFIHGKFRKQVIEQFAQKSPHIFLYKEHHEGLSEDLTNAGEKFGIGLNELRMLGRQQSWFLHGSVADRLFIISRYDPETGTFLGELRID